MILLGSGGSEHPRPGSEPGLPSLGPRPGLSTGHSGLVRTGLFEGRLPVMISEVSDLRL